MSEERRHAKDAPAGEDGEVLETGGVEETEESPASAEHGLWPVERLRPLVEALLFAAADPLPARKIVEIVEGSQVEEVKATLADLSTELLTRGIRLVEVAGGWQLRTAPEHQRYVRKLFRERPQRLTRAATETVAIVAYRQPVTRAEIEVVRGVDCGGVLESLVERRLVKVVGRKDVPGRPLVYATSKEFLELFGLRSLRDMPTLPELGSDFERMSEQSGFGEGEKARILPLEDEDGAQSAEQTGPAEQAGATDRTEE
ncbi:MAG: SMC-Scp complex subunit ScpB [Deltaproteobacteria bacterium]|nr:SMC-Scp complex subunit ScpB [Deltaproteobacteria bacterium]